MVHGTWHDYTELSALYEATNGAASRKNDLSRPVRQLLVRHSVRKRQCAVA